MKRLLMMLCILSILIASAGCMRPEDKLAEDMKSKDPNIRKEAAVQLGELGTPAALKILQLDEDDPDFTVRDQVRASIRKINAQIFMK